MLHLRSSQFVLILFPAWCWIWFLGFSLMVDRSRFRMRRWRGSDLCIFLIFFVVCEVAGPRIFFSRFFCSEGDAILGISAWLVFVLLTSVFSKIDKEYYKISIITKPTVIISITSLIICFIKVMGYDMSDVNSLIVLIVNLNIMDAPPLNE